MDPRAGEMKDIIETTSDILIMAYKTIALYAKEMSEI